MLADLLAATNKRAEAKKIYDRLDTEQPGRADVAMLMGYLAMQNRDANGILTYFSKAFDEGETYLQMCLRLAELIRVAPDSHPRRSFPCSSGR